VVDRKAQPLLDTIDSGWNMVDRQRRHEIETQSVKKNWWRDKQESSMES
jgi:hypothetical protein